MEIFKNILLVVYAIVCLIVILICTFQVKDNNKNLEDTYENPNANKYFDKNKSRTKSGKLQKNTIIVGVIFAILTVITTIVCVIA